MARLPLKNGAVWPDGSVQDTAPIQSGITIPFFFDDDSNTEIAPAAGYIKFDSAPAEDVTHVILSYEDADGNDISQTIQQLFGLSSSADFKGIFKIYGVDDPSKWFAFSFRVFEFDTPDPDFLRVTVDYETAFNIGESFPFDADDLLWFSWFPFTTYGAGNGLSISSGAFAVNVDGSSIEINSDTLRVKDAGVTYTKIQDVSATSRLLGRTTAGSGDVEEVVLDVDGTLAGNSDIKVASQKAVKSYVDAVASGLSPKTSAKLTTTAALAANTYSNGASGVGATLTGVATGVLTIDGVSVAINDRILVKDEAAPARNGIYFCTVAGALGIAYVLTRATDNDTSAEILGSFVFTEAGTTNAGSGFVNTNTSAITIGTTGVTWTQFSGAGEITAGAALTKTGNTLDVGVDGSTIEVSSDALRIKDAGVIYAKIQDVTATSRLLGRTTAGSGDVEEVVLDTDGTLAANSDIIVPSQKAIKTYVAANGGGVSAGAVTQLAWFYGI